MKRYLAYLATAIALAAAPGPTAARETVNINAGWTLITASDASTDGAATVNLPHAQPAAGLVSYLKDMEPQPAWTGKRVFLRVGGASRVADVFVGGVHVASHRGAGAAFTVEITDRLRPDAPTPIRIVVNGTPGLDVMPTAGRERNYCGLFRGVDVIVCNPLSISPAASPERLHQARQDAANETGGHAAVDVNATVGRLSGGGDGVWIATDRLDERRAEGRVRLSLLTPEALPAGAFARVRFHDTEGNVVAQSTAPVTGPEVEIPFTLSGPRLWQGTQDPYLYDAVVALVDDLGATTDSVSLSTGFRTVGVDASNSVTLNGKPLRIRGVVLGRDRMIVGPALSPFQTEEDVDFILEMGANAVRVTGGQHNDYFYQLCDEAGLLVWNDGPFTGAAYPTDIDFVDTDSFRENGRRQLSEMISQLYNHPSVFAWGLFSNVSGRTPATVEYMKRLNALAKGFDAGRLTAAGSVSDGEVNFITDIVSFDLSFGWESGLPDAVAMWLTQLASGWPDLRAGISYSAGGSIFHQSERLERPSPTDPFHPEGWQTFFHDEYMRLAVDAPGLWGVFVGNMFDSGAAKSQAGATALSPAGTPASDGGIDDRGLVTFDRKDRKDAFWLYKAVWNPRDPFVRIAGTRLDNRSERRQKIRVYSNQGEVELLVNGRSQGTRTPTRGTFVWEDVALRTGANRVEARSTGGVFHRTSITISSTGTVPTPPPTPASATSVAIPVGL
jgi:beta-galactosidase